MTFKFTFHCLQFISSWFGLKCHFFLHKLVQLYSWKAGQSNFKILEILSRDFKLQKPFVLKKSSLCKQVTSVYIHRSKHILNVQFQENSTDYISISLKTQLSTSFCEHGNKVWICWGSANHPTLSSPRRAQKTPPKTTTNNK